MNLSPQEAIEQFNLPLKTKPIESSDLEESKYVLIRHGLSTFNYKVMVTADQFGHDSAEMKTLFADPDGADPELHQVGIMQSESHQDFVNNVDWKVVFTSPIQRAMQTTIHMYKNHPNKDKIHFVVLPIVREYLHTTSDVAIDCGELMEKYAEG